VGHILARFVTFLLLPLYTHVFSQEEFGSFGLVRKVYQKDYK